MKFFLWIITQHPVAIKYFIGFHQVLIKIILI